MSQLESFRQEVKDWLEENCPPSRLRKDCYLKNPRRVSDCCGRGGVRNHGAPAHHDSYLLKEIV